MSKTKTETKATQEANTNQDLFADTNVSMKSGHLVKDAEIVSDGKYVKLRFAANKQYLGSDNEIKTNTNYFNALVSSNLTESFDVAKDLKKGDWVYLKGEDSTKSFDTPEGYKQTASTIFAYKVTLKKKKGESSDQNQTSIDYQKENSEPVVA